MKNKKSTKGRKWLKGPNKIERLSNGTIRMFLTQGKSTLIDASSYDKISTFKWYAGYFVNGDKWYVQSYHWIDGKKKTVHLHHLLRENDVEAMQRDIPDQKIVVHHRDHDGLNNCLSNIEATTHQNNIRAQRLHKNKIHSQLKGVNRASTKSKKWYAAIRVDGKQLLSGPFTDQFEAARTYDRLAITHFGNYAVTNFPRSEYVTDFEIFGEVSGSGRVAA